MSHEKMSDFVSFLLLGFTLSHKNENLYFESHLSTLIFSDKKEMASDLSMSHGKMSEFVSFPWNFGNKLRS